MGIEEEGGGPWAWRVGGGGIEEEGGGVMAKNELAEGIVVWVFDAGGVGAQASPRLALHAAKRAAFLSSVFIMGGGVGFSRDTLFVQGGAVGKRSGIGSRGREE